MPNPDKLLLANLIAECSAIESPAERGTVVANWAITMGVSKSTIHRWLAKAQVKPTRISKGGRKVTHDVPDEVLYKIVGLLHRSRRSTGKKMLDYAGAIFAAERAGWIRPNALTEPQLIVWCRKNNVTQTDLSRPAPHIRLKSEHPNQIHLMDASVCIQYDFIDDKKLVFYSINNELEKNKITENVRKRTTMVWRMLLVDHATGAFFVRYYQTSGESAKLTLDFLHEAWTPKPRREMIFHGLPNMLLTDAGPGNTSKIIKNLCASYDIKLRHHQPGNPRAKGAVETMHNVIETQFESLLFLASPRNVGELNEMVDDWQVRFQAHELHSRTGATRYDLWSRNVADHLRIPASEQQFRECAVTDPAERVCNGDLTISFKGTIYKLPADFRQHIGDKVTVRIAPAHSPAVLVSSGKDVNLLAHPVTVDQYGFRDDAKLATRVHRIIPDAAESLRRIADKQDLPEIHVPRMSPAERQGVQFAYPIPAARITAVELPVVHYTVRQALIKITSNLYTLSDSDRVEIRAQLESLSAITDSDIDRLVEQYYSATRFGSARAG